MAQRPHGLLDSYKCGPLHIFILLKTLCLLVVAFEELDCMIL